MSDKTSAEEIYEDGVLGYAAKKLLGDKKDQPKKAVIPVKTIQDNFPVEEKSDGVKEIEEKINLRLNDTKNIKQETIKISEITDEFLNINETKGKTEEQKNKQRLNLLKDIKKSVNKKNDTNKNNNVEISEIFKINEKLLGLLSNGVFKEFEDYIKVDDKYITYIGMGSTNLSVDGNVMLRLSQNESIGNFSIHSIYEPAQVIASKKMLEKKKKQLNIEISSIAEKKGTHNVDLELINALQEVNGILEGLVSQDFKMYRYYNIIQLVDVDKTKLLDRKSELGILLETMNYEMLSFRHLQEPIHNVFGLGGSYDKFLDLSIKDRLPNIFTTDESLSHITNFINKEDTNVKGIPLGLDIFNDRMICRDFWSGDNFNLLLLGSSGTGKSYTMKLVCLREYNDGVKQIIIDPDGEFKDLTENIGGDYINIGSYSDGKDQQLNPFDFNFPKVLMKKHGVEYVIENLDEFGPKIGDEFKEFVARLKTLISLIIFNEKLSSKLYAEISTLLVNFFIDKGGLNPDEPTSYFKIAKHPLSIKKFYSYLQELIDNDDPNKENIQVIKKGLFDYADKNGTFSKFLGEGENIIDIQSDWTAFNLKNVKNGGLRTVIIFIIISFLEQIFAERQEQRTRIVIDEASTFLGANMEIAGYIATLFQRARKYYMGITLIVQGLNNLFVDFKSDEKEVNFGDTILQNSENQIILAQKTNGLNIIQNKMELTPMQYAYLENLKLQKEHNQDVRGKALVITGTSVDQVQIIAEEYIHNYINTDPRSKKD